MQKNTASQPATTLTTEKTVTTKPTVSPTPVKQEQPKDDLNADTTVVYTPNGLFTQTEIAEIKKKYVDPFLDWNNDNKIQTVSITIEKSAELIAGYKYKVNYINKGGSNGGFLYGMNSPLEWWTPECMNGCEFSAEFKATYPEIVNLLD